MKEMRNDSGVYQKGIKKELAMSWGLLHCMMLGV